MAMVWTILGAEECRNPQMLLDPFEKEFDLPPTVI